MNPAPERRWRDGWLATFPVIGALVNNESGALIGLGACLGLGMAAAPLLFSLAAWVAAKV